MTEVYHMSRKQDWQTPPKLFNTLHKEFNFTLDAAADDENHLLPEYYTFNRSGLGNPWAGHTVWCNPPYGRLSIPFWLQKARYEMAENNVTSVLLLPVGVLSRTEFAEHAADAAELRVIAGRLRFVGAPSSAPFGSMLLIYKPNREYLKLTFVSKHDLMAEDENTKEISE